MCRAAAEEGVEAPGPCSRPAWPLVRQQESGVGRREKGGREGGEGGTDFSFKAKGELCQLTAWTCAGPLTRVPCVGGAES